MNEMNGNEKRTNKPYSYVSEPKSSSPTERMRAEPTPLPVLEPIKVPAQPVKTEGSQSPSTVGELQESMSRLDQTVSNLLERKTKTSDKPSVSKNVEKTNSEQSKQIEPANKPEPRTNESTGFRGLARYQFSDEPPLGAGFHIATKKGFEPVRGNVAAQVGHRGWYLNGMRVILGTTAADADKAPRTTVDGVEGALPRAVDWLYRMAKSTKEIDPDSRYNEDRPYQFGVSLILSREDFRGLMGEMSVMSKNHKAALAKAGARTEVIKAVVYNERGMPLVLAVKFKDKKAGKGTHFIYLHSTTLLGGGKTDLSLLDGNAKSQASRLSNEFEWWIRALEKGNGVIAAIEGGLGGTARQANYALLMRAIPPRLISKDAIDYVNVDRSSWVHNHLASEQPSYHMNYTTTLLRKAWGSSGKPFSTVPLNLVDRQTPTSRQVRDIKSSMAILRSLFSGLPEVSPIKGDLSDQRWAERREMICTDNEYLDIFDPVESRGDGPWEQHRRIRTMNSDYISKQRFKRIGLGEASEDLADTANNLLNGGRALAAIEHDSLPPGMYCTLEVMVPANSGFSSDLVNEVGEAIATGIRRAGVEHVVTIYNEVVNGLTECDDIIVTLTEDHAGTTLLMVKTDESNPHKRRKLVRNHSGPWTDQKWTKGCKAYNRLMREVQDAHLRSGLPACIADGELIRVFASHWYSGKFASRPEHGLGGKHDRPLQGRSIESGGGSK